MPLYEYQCDACAARFERIQKFSDPPVDACPACGGSVRKLLSSPAIQFKGSGWYITDYAKKAGSKSDDKTAKASGDGASGEAKDSAGKDATAKDSTSSKPATASTGGGSSSDS